MLPYLPNPTFTHPPLKVMYARKEDERSAVFRKALEVGEDYQWRVKVKGVLGGRVP